MSERYTDGFENVGTNAKRPRRILIDDELDAIDAVDDLKAPLASPTFTGTVTLPATVVLNGVTLLPTGTELNYVDGVTSALQTQLNAKQAVVSGVDDTEIGYLNGVTSAIQTQLNAKQAVVSGVDDTEIGYLNGVTSAIQTQMDTKAPLASPIFTTTALRSTVGNGTANTGTTAVEYGDGRQHTTVLTVNTTLPAIAGGAALSVGKLLYTLPAGAVVVDKAYMSMAVTQTEAHINADTPDVGLGTAIAAGANALLSDTADAENLLTGQTANDCTGTAEVKTVANQVLVIEAAGNHTVYFNVADDWAASGDAAALLTGTVVLHWQFMA